MSLQTEWAGISAALLSDGTRISEYQSVIGILSRTASGVMAWIIQIISKYKLMKI